MEKNERAVIAADVVYLVGCALHDICPDWQVPGDLTPHFRFCQEHSLTAMAAMALEAYWKTCPPADPEVITPWKQAKEKAIRKNILLNVERQRILAWLDSIGCWYLPLKGSLLQYDYPKFGMRQMGDNDILVDPAFLDQIYEFMTAEGYQCHDHGKGNHDEYTKPPVYNYEFHNRLFTASGYPRLAAAYEDILPLVEKDSDNQFGYHFPEEEFYVYLMAHAYKHACAGGTGLRTLVDCYVYRWKHPGMDLDKVQSRLEELGIGDFEAHCLAYGQMLFGQPRHLDLAGPEYTDLWAFLDAGTYGNLDNKIQNRMKNFLPESGKGTVLDKLRYVWHRLFLPVDMVLDWDPSYRDKPWKLVGFYVKRVFRVLFKTPGKLWRELTLIWKGRSS